MQNILIIEGTGTISLPTTLKLSENPQNRVTVINRGSKNDQLPSNITVVKGDINKPDEIQEWLSDKHFDSIINFVIFNPESAQKNSQLFKERTNQFVYISTVAALNHQNNCLVNEETAYRNEFSDYGKNKAIAEALFLEEFHTNNFPITIVRPTQTYSEDRIPLSIKGKNCWSVVQRMIDGKEVIVHGEGQSVWASTHASDFAEGIYPIIGNAQTIGEIYQIMNPEPHTWDMVYQYLADELAVEYKPIYIPTDFLKESTRYNFSESIQGDKRWSNIFDISKLLSINPTFTCKISLKEGLQKYLKHMDEHPELKEVDKEFDSWCEETIANYKVVKEKFLTSFE